MKRRPPRPLIAVVVLLLVGGGIFWWWWAHRNTTAANVASGSVEATQYQVAPALTGRVARLLVSEGDTVTAGQKLVILDDSALRIQVQQAQQGVAAAQAALDQVKDGTTAEKAEATAKLNQAKASVDLAKIQLGYATVTAPHAGRVISVITNVGQNASPGLTLLIIQDDTDLYAQVYVPETELGKVKVGATGHVTADGVPASDGTVTFVSSSAEFTPNTVQTADQRTKLVYQVQVHIKDTSGAYKPGMPVDVTF